MPLILFQDYINIVAHVLPGNYLETLFAQSYQETAISIKSVDSFLSEVITKYFHDELDLSLDRIVLYLVLDEIKRKSVLRISK